MKKASLLTTNSYLKDHRNRDKLLRRTVLTSSAVEGVVKSAAKALGLSGKQFSTPDEATVSEQP